MTRLRRALFASAVLIPCLSAAPSTQPAPSPSSSSALERENAVLRRRVELLEDRVAELERRLARGDEAQARARLRVVPRTPDLREPGVQPYIPLTPNAPRVGREGWQPREFNGLRYYVLPTEP